MEDGSQYAERVPQITHKILDWLDRKHVKITFFTVGDIAENYPELIQEIKHRGHEIACHSYRHITLDKQSPEVFQKDLESNIKALIDAGAEAPTGYRAPVFSLTEDRAWVYSILKQSGITYSSSVLPAQNPLFGWLGFGENAKDIEGVLEIPMSVGTFLGKTVPFGGGVYFRVLPFGWIKRQFRMFETKGAPINSYMHPYDFDTEQEHFMHPGINNSKFYNHLMYRGRKKTFSRLDVFAKEYTIIPFQQYVTAQRNEL